MFTSYLRNVITMCSLHQRGYPFIAMKSDFLYKSVLVACDKGHTGSQQTSLRGNIILGTSKENKFSLWIFNSLFSSRRPQVTVSSNLALVGKCENSNNDLENTKIKILDQMKFSCKEDSLPFLQLRITTLLKILKRYHEDQKYINCDNRLYYLAEKLECNATELSVKVAKRAFLFTRPFEKIQESLDALIEMGVDRERIRKDLWSVLYSRDTIRARLGRVRAQGRHDLYPWMVRCSQDILSRSMEICQNTKKILGEKNTTQLYLVERLKTTPEMYDIMCTRNPSIRTIRVTKAKAFLDFLFNEGYSADDIIRCPRILAPSLKTVAMRMRVLRSYGMKHIHLNYLCVSKQEFKQHIDKLKKT